MRLPSPAMVVALIALIVAMSGSAYAVTQLPRNSVGTAQLKKNAVSAVKLRNNAVTSAKIKNGAVTTPKIKNGAVTGAKIEDGAVDLADLSLAARTGIVQSAYAANQGPVDPENTPALDTDDGAEIMATTLTTPGPARLIINAKLLALANLLHASQDTQYDVDCWSTVAGARIGRVSAQSVTMITPSQLTAATIPVTSAAEVEAGEHRIAIRCRQTRPDGGYLALTNNELAVIATPR